MPLRFCESCGHDSALPTGEPSRWIAIVDADPEFYRRAAARSGNGRVEFPRSFEPRRITLQDSVTLVGRRNRRQQIAPRIDLGIPPVDRGVSTRHAELRIRDSGLTVADLGSTNGTSLNGSNELLQVNHEVRLSVGDRIHVGAWTTITIGELDWG